MKNYKVKVYFHSGTSNLFGYSNDSIECLVPEDVKDGIVDALEYGTKSNTILSITMLDGGMRYINMRTVLYVDVKETGNEEQK